MVEAKHLLPWEGSVSKRFAVWVGIIVSLTSGLFLPALQAATPAEVNKQADGIELALPTGTLRLQVLSDTVIRVAFAPEAAFFSRHSIDVLPHEQSQTEWKSTTSPAEVILTTGKLQVHVNRSTGQVRFEDAAGKPILSEADSGRSLEAATVQGDKTFHIQQQWKPNSDESLYGLGQQQLGIVDIKGYDLDLWQHNTNIALPFLVSSRGYGILWDNTSYTRFGDLREFTAIPAAQLLDRAGQPGGLTLQPMDGSAPATRTADIEVNFKPTQGSWAPKSQRWEGSVVAPVSGEYQFQAYSNGGIHVWIDNRSVMHHWRQNWLTSNDQVKLHLEAGHRYPIKIETDGEQQTTLAVPMEDTVGDECDFVMVEGW